MHVNLKDAEEYTLDRQWWWTLAHLVGSMHGKALSDSDS